MPTKTETADELKLSSEEKYLHFKISNYLGSFSQLLLKLLTKTSLLMLTIIAD